MNLTNKAQFSENETPALKIQFLASELTHASIIFFGPGTCGCARKEISGVPGIGWAIGTGLGIGIGIQGVLEQKQCVNFSPNFVFRELISCVLTGLNEHY